MPDAPPTGDPPTTLSDRLSPRFADPSALELALTHRSWAAEHGDGSSNERLEFLGDAVLGLAVAARAYEAYPQMSEGEFSKLRAQVVNEASLAGVARQHALGEVLRLGKGEDQSGGRDKPSILADALEAVIGAVFVDAGWEAARALVDELMADRLASAAVEGPGGQDHKTRLQEWAAQHFADPPRYEVRDAGPDHQKSFFASVQLADEVWGTGEGRSKKQAEQAAAGAAWARVEGFDGAGEGAGDSPPATREASDVGVA